MTSAVHPFRSRLGRAVGVLSVLLAAGCGSTAVAPATAPPAGSTAEVPVGPLVAELAGQVSVDGAWTHLEALQRIADENGGNRASGFQGYGASVQYVLTKLRDAGYRPTTQVFDFVTFEETAEPVLREVSPTAKTYAPGTEFLTMNYSASGDTGEATITAVDHPVGRQ